EERLAHPRRTSAPCEPSLCFLLPKSLGLADLREYVRLAQDEQFIAVDGDLGASVLGVEDLIALTHVQRPAAAVLLDGSVADSEHLALLRLLLGRVGENDSACGRLLLIDRLHDQAVAKWLQLHRHSSI